MLAYSQFYNPIDFGARDLSLFEFLRTSKVSQKSRMATKPPAPVVKSDLARAIEEFNAQSKPRQKKTVRFSETVYVRTFRRLSEEVQVKEPAPVSPVQPEQKPAFHFASSSPINQPSFSESPYFKAFTASNADLTTIPRHYGI